MSHYFLDKLKIKNFRNLEDDIVSFNSRVNYIFGENGNGKTNLLEAIYVITEKKSFRKNTSFPQLVNINGEEPEILFQTKFKDIKDKEHAYSGRLITEKNEYFLNGKPTKEKFKIHSVFINPFDSLFFHNTPSFRRQWFDQSLSAIDQQYRKALRHYQQVLKMRNILLLKRPPRYRDQIKAIDGEMAKYSFLLVQKRIQFIGELEGLFTQIFCEFFSPAHEMKIKIQSKFALLNIDEVYSALQKQLAERYSFGKNQLRDSSR